MPRISFDKAIDEIDDLIDRGCVIKMFMLTQEMTFQFEPILKDFDVVTYKDSGMFRFETGIGTIDILDDYIIEIKQSGAYIIIEVPEMTITIKPY